MGRFFCILLKIACKRDQIRKEERQRREAESRARSEAEYRAREEAKKKEVDKLLAKRKRH